MQTNDEFMSAQVANIFKAISRNPKMKKSIKLDFGKDINILDLHIQSRNHNQKNDLNIDRNLLIFNTEIYKYGLSLCTNII